MTNRRRFKTYSEPVRVTDREAVQSLVNKYRFPIDVEVFLVPGTDKLRVDGNGNFLEAYTTESNEPMEVGMEVPQTPALEEFFTELSAFIATDDELVIQLVGIGASDDPLLAVEWAISSTGVREIAFEIGDSRDWTSLKSTPAE